jgi:hypothetical protein
MLEILSHLLPQLDLLQTPEFEQTEIGVWFWIVMIALSVFCVLAVLTQLWSFLARLRLINNLIDGQTRHTLGQNRADTLDRALAADPKLTGPLWQEFDESLVYSADKTKLSNTLDAEQFFNKNTLAVGLTSSRLLSAAPTFLTAIGVLGTFVGLTLGLEGLDISEENPEALFDGVSQMINGAAVAFMTSVWGVFLSLGINLFEKIIESVALAKIRKLQRSIDSLYPLLPAEYSLVQIASATQESQVALQELHERIGDRLQETVAGVSEAMQQAFTDALNNVMAPAIQTLVSNASQQSTAVLANLVENFMDGMKTAGAEQGLAIKTAAVDVQSAVTNLTSQIESLFQKVNDYQVAAASHTQNASQEFLDSLERQRIESNNRLSEMEQQFSQLMGQFSAVSTEQIQGLKDVSLAQQDKLGQTFETAMAALSDVINKQSSSASERESEMERRFENNLERLTEEQQLLLSAVTEGTQKSQIQMVKMAQQHEHLLEQLSTVSQSIEASSQNMNRSSTQLGLLSTNLKQATDVLDTRLKAVTDSLEKVAAQNDELAGQVIQQAQSLKLLQQELYKAVENFALAASAAENGFEALGEHQEEFLEGVGRQFEKLGESLRLQVVDVEKQADQWLRSYSNEVRTQVSERMELWNENTLRFADQMRRTVTAISGLVDDLENKR